MKKQPRIADILVSLVLAASGLQSVFAQLPTLDEPPWLEYFAAYPGNRYHFGIASIGEMILRPVGPKGPVSEGVVIRLNPTVLETMPNGKISAKHMIPESLETSDSATDKLEKTVFRGKATGGSSFEVTVEQTRGTVFIGGRILDPGTAKNPRRFAITARVPNLYPAEPRKLKPDDKKEDEREHKKQEKEFFEKLEDGRVSLKWVDGKQMKHDLSETVDMSAKNASGPAMVELELESGSYGGRRVQFAASPDSLMTLSSPKPAPLYKGFLIQWTPDPAKDPDGQARLAISVR